MSDQIRLHKKYGLNPTLSTCLYCGKETGEIALLGANYDGEAPRHPCANIEPCAECKEKFKGLVVIVEATLDKKNNPTPTGRWTAVEKECITVSNKLIFVSLTQRQ